MTITLASGATSVEFKATQVFKRKKWRVQNIPLVAENPYCFDLGLELSEAEVIMWMNEADFLLLDALVNPVQVTASSYPEVSTGWYRFEKVQAVRKAAYVTQRECTITMIRDFYYTP